MSAQSDLLAIIESDSSHSAALLGDLEIALPLSVLVVTADKQVSIARDLQDLPVGRILPPVTETDPLLADGDSTPISVTLRIPFTLIKVALLAKHGPPLKQAVGVVDVVLGSCWHAELLYEVDCFESISTRRVTKVHGHLVFSFSKNVFIGST